MNNKKIVSLIIALALVSIFLSSCQISEKVTEKMVSSQSIESAGDLTEQTSTQGAVTISVTPKNLSMDSISLDFDVNLSTHSVELSDDLLEVAVLIDDKGNEYKPIEWDGAAPGGHHREGVLKFTPVDSSSISLKIADIVEGEESTFDWSIKL